MKKIIGMIFIGALLLTMFPAISSAQVPQTTNYQGFLTDSAGDPVNGPVDMTFRIYDSADPLVVPVGSQSWIETHTLVLVTQGVYSVVLGSAGSPLTLDFNTQYWLGIEVGTDGEMDPRQQLTAVPYALNADTVDGQHASDLGDITGVTAGTGIIGGGLSGNVTIGIGVPLVLTNNGTPPIIGINDGLNYAVRGYNSTNGNQGMLAGPSYSVMGNGSAGTKAVYGLSSGGTGVGVEGHNSTSLNTGQLGTNNAAVSGSSTSGIAGYFNSPSGYGIIVETGNVGIGTGSPAYNLDVAGTINASTSIKINGVDVLTSYIDTTLNEAQVDSFVSNNGYLTAPAQRIVVSQSGGDYTTISAALAAITPSAASPYVVEVMPGSYNEDIVMKSYVHLKGSGQNVTTLAGSASTPIITLNGISNVTISGFNISGGPGSTGINIINSIGSTIYNSSIVHNRIENNGLYGIFIDGSSPRIEENLFVGNGNDGNACAITPATNECSAAIYSKNWAGSTIIDNLFVNNFMSIAEAGILDGNPVNSLIVENKFWSIASQTDIYLRQTNDIVAENFFRAGKIELFNINSEGDSSRASIISNTGITLIDAWPFSNYLEYHNGFSSDIADNSVSTVKLQDGAVTEQKIADNAVTEQKIADNAVTETKIGAGAVTVNKIGAGAVTVSKIGNGAITEQKIADRAVTGLKIDFDAVGPTEIADGAVTRPKIAADAITRGRIVGTEVPIYQGIAACGSAGVITLQTTCTTNWCAPVPLFWTCNQNCTNPIPDECSLPVLGYLLDPSAL